MNLTQFNICIFIYVFFAAGNYADCETESQWALKAVLITVSVVLVLIVSYCIYRRKRLNGGEL